MVLRGPIPTLLLLAALALPGPARAQSIALTGWSGSGFTALPDNVGFTFSTSSRLRISALGFFDLSQNGLAASHEVGIWRLSDQALMVSGTVAAGTAAPLDGEFRYVTVPETLLEPGSYVVSAVTTGDTYLTNLASPELSWPLSYVSGRDTFPDETVGLVFPNQAAGNNHAPANFEFVVVPPEGATLYEYDGLDRVTQVTYGDGSSVAYAYDPAGNVVSRTMLPEPGALGMLLAGAWLVAALDVRRRRRKQGAGLVLAALLAIVASGSPAQAQPAKLESAWGEAVRERIERSEYEVRWTPVGLRDRGEAWQAPNRKQNLRTHFVDAGIRVTPREHAADGWEIGLSLLSYGRGATATAAEPGTPRADGHRVRYQRGGIAEWFVNQPQGLEQGFTLDAPPRRPRGARAAGLGARVGSAESDDAPAYLALRVDGDVTPVLAADRQSVDFVRAGSPIAVAHYAKLEVYDADRRRLESWMEVFRDVSGHGIRLVFDDRDAAYPVEVDPLLTTPTWTIAGSQAGAGLGFSVAGAGDVNGDGFDDVLVGAPWFDHFPGTTDSGRAYLFFGSPGGLSTVPAWLAYGEWPIALGGMPGARMFTHFGAAVAGAGDVDGDGFDDILVSKAQADPPSFNETVFLYRGSPTGPGLVSDWRLEGRLGFRLGISVAGIGDVNGDGRDDLAFGEPGADFEEGRVYVFYGEPLARLGGGTHCTATTLAAGGASCPPVATPTLPPTVWGETGSDWFFGERVAGAGDVNCDGYADLVAGQPEWGGSSASPDTDDEGSVQIYLGGAGGLATTAIFQVDGQALEGGAAAGDDAIQLGRGLAGAGQHDFLSACDDVLVGAPGRDDDADALADAGAVYLIRGASGASPTLSIEAAPVFLGTTATGNLGASIARVDDVNGDTFADFLVGAPGPPPPPVLQSRGSAFLFLGPAPGNTLSGNPVWRFDGADDDDHLGVAVAGAGHVDADTLGDIVIGSPSARWDTSPSGPGNAFVFRGALPAPVFSFLGLDPASVVDSFAWGGDVSTQIDPTSSWSPFVSGGSSPNSLIVSSGLAQDGGMGSTDWDDDGQRDKAGTGLLLDVPPGAKTLRFTTQYLTADPDQDPRADASLRYQYGGPLSHFLTEWYILDTPLERTGQGEAHAPVSHAIDVSDEGQSGGQIAFQLTVIDASGEADVDAGVVLSQVYFTDVELPGHLSDPAQASFIPDANANSVVDYVVNPRSSDVAASAGTFRHQMALIDVPGLGVPIDFRIHYDSERTREDVLGPKWTHTLGFRLEEFPDFDTDGCADTVYVWVADGSIESFKEEDAAVGGSCTYEPSHPSVLSTLTHSDIVIAEQYSHETKDHVSARFDVDHTLPIPRAGFMDHRGDAGGAISVFRDPTTQRIDSIQDSRQEWYAFVYDESFTPHRLESVTGPGVQVQFDYGALGFLDSVTDANGLATTFTYDQNGNLLTITDADGVRLVANEYETLPGTGVEQSSNRVVLQRNANPGDAGRITSFVNDTHEIRDREDGVRLDRYDVFGRLVESRVLLDSGAATSLDGCDRTKPWCAVWSYAYNELNQLVETVDPRGVVTETAYDASGDLICRTEDAGGLFGSPSRIGMLYDARDNPTKRLLQRDAGDLPDCPGNGDTTLPPAQEPKWLDTSFAYGPIDEPLSQTDPLGRVTMLDYFVPYWGRLPESMTDPAGATQDFAYGPKGDLVTVTDALLGETRYTYDVLGRQTSMTDPRGFQSFELRDATGRLISTIDPREDPLDPGSPSLGGYQLFGYDAQGRQTSRRDRAGFSWTTSYTPTGRIETQTDPLGHAAAHAYDAEDRLVSRIDPRGNETTRAYDAAGRLVSGSDPLGASVSIEYDKAGNRTAVTDPRSNRTEYEYDGLGRRTLLRDALGNETSFGFDTSGQETTRTDPNPSGPPIVWSRGYTDAGALERITDPEGLVTTFSYDAVDQVDLLTHVALGRVTDHDYDLLGRLSGVSVSTPGEGVLATVSAVYDAAGNNTQVTDPNGNTTDFEYDGMNRITLERDGEGNEIEVDFEARGLVSARTNARGQVVSFLYDGAARQVSSAGTDAATGSWSIVETLDPNGNPTASTGANPTTPALAPASVQRSFDARDRQTVRTVELAPGLSRSVESEYDAAGNLAAVVYSDGSRVDYAYDVLNRLASVTDGPRVTSYEYDAVGNLTRVVRPDGSDTVYSYDLASRLLSVLDSGPGGTVFQAQYTLDAAGRRIYAELDLPLEPALEASESFAYDDANRLATRGAELLQHDADGNLTAGTLGGSLRSLSYNALNQLVAVDGETLRYDADGRRVSRTTGGVTTFYLYDTRGRLLEELDASGNVVARYVHGAGLISREDAGQVSVYHYDSRGSTLALTDATSGAITDRYAYTPYGAVQHDPANATSNPFTYSGRDGVVDDGNGLFYMRARYYAPELMRFVQKDPAYAGEIGRPQSLNRYAYVEGNPIELTDPTGEWGVLGSIVGAGVGFVANATKAALEGKDLDEILEAGAEGAVAGAIVGATGGVGLIAGGIGAGVAAATGGNIAVGAAVGALSTFGIGAAAAAAFAGEFYEAGGSLEQRAVAGGFGAAGVLAFGGLGKVGGKALAKSGLTKRLSQTGVVKNIGDKAANRAARNYVARADRLAQKLHKPGSVPLHNYLHQVRPGIANASGFVRSSTRKSVSDFADELQDAAIEYVVFEQLLPDAP